MAQASEVVQTSTPSHQIAPSGVVARTSTVAQADAEMRPIPAAQPSSATQADPVSPNAGSIESLLQLIYNDIQSMKADISALRLARNHNVVEAELPVVR